jgi:hypothetical protein
MDLDGKLGKAGKGTKDSEAARKRFLKGPEELEKEEGPEAGGKGHVILLMCDLRVTYANA